MDQPNSSTLLAALQQIPDPRHKRGQSFEWPFLVAILCASMVAGCTSVAGMTQWLDTHGDEILQGMHPHKRRLPSAATIRRVLVAVPVAAVEACVARYVMALDADDRGGGSSAGAGGRWRGQAVDGKDVRGASAHGESTFLVSLVRHESGYVLRQVRVNEKSNEITAVPALLDGLNLQGTVTTMDALLTQRSISQRIVQQQGHFLMVVKENQPELYQAIELLFQQPPVPRRPGDILSYTSREKGHGRWETRTLEASAALTSYLSWPGLGQVLRRTCRRVLVKSGVVQTHMTYGITSLRPDQAGPRQLEALWRGHWTIENKVHYVRDETFGEDRGQMHSGDAAETLAAFRNAIVSALRDQGWTNISRACRHYEAPASRALQFIGAGAT